MTGPLPDADPLLEGLARYLDALGHGSYTVGVPAAPGRAPIVLYDVPAAPAELLVLTPYQVQTEPDYRGRWAEPWIQVRIRDTDPDRSARRARAVFDALNGLGSTPGADLVELEGGVVVMSIIATQTAPVPIGRDAAGLHEWTCNFRIDHAVTD